MEWKHDKKEPANDQMALLSKAGGNQTVLQLLNRASERYKVSMDDVNIHFNSSKPPEYGALAYTQGNEVHIGPGQEKHLKHELGHVVQQKLGKVTPTSMVAGQPLNDSPELEREADVLLS